MISEKREVKSVLLKSFKDSGMFSSTDKLIGEEDIGFFDLVILGE